MKTSDNFDEISRKYTIKELADMWGISISAIRMAIKNKRFNTDELQKESGVWLITEKQMIEVFGDYSDAKLKKIKREAKKIDISKSTKNIINKAVDEFIRSIDVKNFEYESFKKEVVENLEKNKLKNIEYILNILKTENNETISYLITQSDMYLYTVFFENLFKKYNAAIEEFGNDIKQVYYVVQNPKKNNPIKNMFRMSTYSMEDSTYGYSKYRRDFRLKIMGLTKSDIESDKEGIEIGELYCIFYNFSKMIADGLIEDVWMIMDSFDQISRDICDMFFGRDFNAPHENLMGEKENLLYIKEIYLDEKYRIDNIKEMILKSIEKSIDYLYDYEIGTLAFFPYYIYDKNEDVTEEKIELDADKNIGFLEKLGFTEINNGNYSIMFINTDLMHSKKTIEVKDDFKLDLYENEDIDLIEIELGKLEKVVLTEIINKRIQIDSEYLNFAVIQNTIDIESEGLYQACIDICKDILEKISDDNSYRLYLTDDEFEQLMLIVNIQLNEECLDIQKREILNNFHERYSN